MATMSEDRTTATSNQTNIKTSPIRTPDRPPSRKICEDQSLQLMNASFDTLSDPAGVFDFDKSLLTPLKRPIRSDLPLDHVLNIPDLKFRSPSSEDTSDVSIGDISPIKLVQSRDSLEEPGHFPEPRGRVVRRAETSIIPSDWNTERDQHAISNPFYVLRSARESMQHLTYLLPCVTSKSASSVNMSDHGSIRHYKGGSTQSIGPVDIKIASRRVNCAIHAFGGHTRRQSKKASIFRQKTLPSKSSMNSSSSSSTGSPLDAQFCVEIIKPVDSVPQKCTKDLSDTDDTRSDDKEIHHVSSPSSHSLSFSSSSGDDQQKSKLKYRCKMCGQIKRDHLCPFGQGLQRNIGTNVYPSINAYAAAEPGRFAEDLSDMNNFVPYNQDQYSPSTVYNRHRGQYGLPKSITPDSQRGALLHQSPQSSLSEHSHEAHSPMLGHFDSKKKRSYEQMTTSQFVAPMALSPEQYRAVSPTSESPQSYQYPPVPLSFDERKRLSDTLFFLSKEVPSWTGECAVLLRAARAKDEWDLAVAELLTQLAIGLYCPEGDSRLDGLQQYMSAIGIAC